MQRHGRVSWLTAWWLGVLCLCTGPGAVGWTGVHAQTPASTFLDADTAQATREALQSALGVTVAPAGTWSPYRLHYKQAWQSLWYRPGSWHHALLSLEWEQGAGQVDSRWATYAQTIYRGIPSPRATAIQTYSQYVQYWPLLEAMVENGFAQLEGTTPDMAVPPTEPRLYLPSSPHLQGAPATVLGQTLHSHARPMPQAECWSIYDTAHPSTWGRLRSHFWASPPTTPRGDTPEHQLVQLPHTPRDRFTAPLLVATSDRQTALQSARDHPVELQLALCHDGHFGAPEALLDPSVWALPREDWGYAHKTAGHSATDMVFGANYPGTPLVQFIQPQEVRLLVSQPVATHDYGKSYWNDAWAINFDWEGYILEAQSTALVTCACSFPEWTSGEGCRTLICYDGEAGVPPDQFWPYCIHTLRRMCNGNPVTRRACGPDYDSDPSNPSGRGAYNPATGSWECACDTSFWEAYPAAQGFALEEPAPGVGLLATEAPRCVGGPPCSVMAFCSDHIDLGAGFNATTHLPNAWINFVGEHANLRQTCNGHGSCGDRGKVAFLEDGSQVFGHCRCEGHYRDIGCTRCDTEAGWWDYDGGCTKSCMSRSRLCHGAGTCDSFEGCSCEETSHRDPATNCATCALGYVIDATSCPLQEDGTRDMGHPDCRCVEGSTCMDEATGTLCAGHGVCQSAAYSPRLDNRCLCDPDWTGFTCNTNAAHCAAVPALRACKFPATQRQCERTRLFLWPPDPSQDTQNLLAGLSATTLQQLQQAAPHTNLSTLTGTVAQVWPNTAALNQAGCAQASGWTGATPATPQDWEQASAHTRSQVLLQMAGQDSNYQMVLAHASIPGGGTVYYSLAIGTLRSVPTDDLAPTRQLGPALCMRDNCQIDTTQCTQVALRETCSSHERVRVFPVKMGSVYPDDARRVCARYGMIPLVRNHVLRARSSWARSEESYELETAYRAAVDAVLGNGGFTAMQTRTTEDRYGTRTYITNAVVVLTTKTFAANGAPERVEGATLYDFSFSTYSNQWPSQHHRLEAFQGWCFVACSRHCVTSSMWGPDPDCQVVLGG